MSRPSGSDLIEALRVLPAAAPLLAALGPADAVYVVGGAVRDMLRGAPPGDLDFAVEGDAAALAERLGAPVRRHTRFGTASVVVDGRVFDIARTRREHYPAPG